MPNYDNALHTAAYEGNLAQARSQVRYFDVNAKGGGDETALLKAVARGKTDVVVFLLTSNADVNIPNVSILTMISDMCFPYPSYTKPFFPAPLGMHVIKA